VVPVDDRSPSEGGVGEGQYETQDTPVDRTRGSVVVGTELQVTELQGKVNDDVRQALQSLESLWERKDMRINVLRTLSNPWPEKPAHDKNVRPSATRKWYLPEVNGAPISHAVFRKNLSIAPNEKVARQILRAQLLRCETPTDILRIVAVAMLQRQTQLQVARMHEAIMRALYRCRNNANDSKILRTLTAILARWEIHGVPVHPDLIAFGLKFAARSRDLKYMKKYLQDFRERGLHMTGNVFRSVIAKCSIGHNGLGEIRNGRWRRRDLLQVLTGFEDCQHLASEQQYHLGTFLIRDDWQFLHGWITVLARCKHVAGVRREWEVWKRSEARTRPKNLARLGTQMTSRLRGDFWFVEQMACSGGLRQAWQIFEESEIRFVNLKDRVKTSLLEGVEHATIWNDDIRSEMLRKYDTDLSKIERALGVRWMSAGTVDAAEGQHVLAEEQEEALDRLGAEDWKLEEDYGYPYDEPLVPQSERSLHLAVETTPAEPEEGRS